MVELFHIVTLLSRSAFSQTFGGDLQFRLKLALMLFSLTNAGVALAELEMESFSAVVLLS